MIRRTRLVATSLLAGVALLLGACGGGDDDSSAAPAPAGATGEPVAGGSARVLQANDPRSLDPVTLVNAWQLNAFVGNALYGTLMTNDVNTGEIQYQMAESFTTEDGGSTFTVKLRPGLQFSDGTPLNAEAVKFNWERHKDPANGSGYLPEASLIASMEAVDDTTLKLTMTEPVPNFPSALLTTSMNWIASPAALEKGAEAFNANPVGAGPYTLKSWTRQDKIELVRNPKYWDAPRPYLDEIVVRTSNDTGQRYNSLVSGGADVIIETNSDNIAKAQEAGYPTDVVPLNGGLFLAMNMDRAPFDDLRARQAVAAALDLESLNLTVYNGTATIAKTLFNEASPFYSDKPLWKPDKELAQRLFDELAAEGKPVNFKFTSFPSPEMRDIAEAVQTQLSAFKNVKVEIEVVEFAKSYELQANRGFDMLVWSASFIDPDPRMAAAFRSGSSGNFPGIADEELDKALDAGRTALTLEERKAAYDTVQQRLIDLVPGIYLVRANPGVMAGKNVGGLVQYGLGSLLPEQLWIQK